MAVQDEALEKLACCVLAIQYIICSTVGRSIASIYNLSAHIYLGASVVCIGYGPPYRTIYITYTHLVSRSQPHSPEQQNVFLRRTYAAPCS